MPESAISHSVSVGITSFVTNMLIVPAVLMTSNQVADWSTGMTSKVAVTGTVGTALSTLTAAFGYYIAPTLSPSMPFLLNAVTPFLLNAVTEGINGLLIREEQWDQHINKYCYEGHTDYNACGSVLDDAINNEGSDTREFAVKTAFIATTATVALYGSYKAAKHIGEQLNLLGFFSSPNREQHSQHVITMSQYRQQSIREQQTQHLENGENPENSVELQEITTTQPLLS